MNLILFEHDEWNQPLSLSDRRSLHLVEILKIKPGERFAAGEIEGPWGSLMFDGASEAGLHFSAPEFSRISVPLEPLALLIGTPRPPTARRLLRDLTTLGVSRLVFVATELGEKSYLQSHLWKTDWRDALIEGAMQAKTTHLPVVERFDSLREALKSVFRTDRSQPSPRLGPSPWLAFDAPGAPLATVFSGMKSFVPSPDSPIWLALGPERGWTDNERSLLTEAGWSFVSLGERILRTETACSVAAGLVLHQGR